VSEVLKRAKALFGRGEPEQKPLPAKKAVNPWHAVSIVPGAPACDAANGLRGQKFLSRAAPALPLKTCTARTCTCRYEHHDDRRKGPRRAHELGVAIDGYDSVEKRSRGKRGRRTKDT
jgi:hypothetical protein